MSFVFPPGLKRVSLKNVSVARLIATVGNAENGAFPVRVHSRTQLLAEDADSQSFSHGKMGGLSWLRSTQFTSSAVGCWQG